MATVEAKSATLAALVIGATSPIAAQIGFLAWGAMVGGIMAIAASAETVTAPRAAGRIVIGMLAAVLVGGLVADVAPRLPWLAGYGIAPESLWGLVGLAIGGLWLPGIRFAQSKLTRGKHDGT